MKYKTVLYGLILLLYTDNIDAGRSSSSSRGSSSGRGSSSRSSYSTSHTSHSSSSHSSYTPTSHSTSHSTYSRPDKSGSSSLIFGERHQSSGSQPKPSAPVVPPSYTNSHPSTFNTANSRPPYPTSNSDKPAWSNPHYNPNPSKPPYPTSNGDKPAWSNPHFNPSPSNPPYPSNPHLPTSSTSQGGTQGGNHLYPVLPPNRHSSHSYNNSNSGGVYNPTVTNNRLQQSASNRTGSGTVSHPGTYDPSPPYPPFPSSSKPAPYPTGTGSMPQPNSKATAPYPVGTGSMPQPNSHLPPPYPMGTGSMPQPGHTGNVGFHSSMSHPNYNTMSQPNLATPHYNAPLSQGGYHPSMAQPAYNPHFSSHSYGQPSYGQPSYHPTMAQPGGYYPQPVYQPAPPASGPVIIMAGQQSGGGRGLGQMIAEAAVFSTINAGVNRLINPYPSFHHHDGYQSGVPSQTSQSSSTTHITYNNYLNGQPMSPGQMPTGVSTVPGGVPGGYPSGTYPSGSSPTGTFPAGVNPAVYPGGTNNGNSAPSSGGYTPDISGFGSTGSTYNPTGNSGSNIPAPGIVTKVDPNNKTEPPSPPINPLNDSSLVIYGISNAEFWKLTEDLFAKQEFNASEFIKVDLQNKTNSTEDVANKPLFEIGKGAFEHPTIRAVRDLFNVFESDSRVKENRTLERRQKENILLDTMMNTDVMDTAMSWLTSKRFLDQDDFERKDTLGHIWFNLFDGSSSGFERVFVSEKLHTADSAVILGVQDWLSFSHLEEEKRIDYAGYVDQLPLGNNHSSLLKLNYKMNDLVVLNTTIFVGTLPELEMALYTVCFYARPGIECPVSLGGTKFNLYTHMMPYFGKYLIAAAYPSI